MGNGGYAGGTSLTHRFLADAKKLFKRTQVDITHKDAIIRQRRISIFVFVIVNEVVLQTRCVSRYHVR